MPEQETLKHGVGHMAKVQLLTVAGHVPVNN
jgi:hypothetical protein